MQPVFRSRQRDAVSKVRTLRIFFVILLYPRLYWSADDQNEKLRDQLCGEEEVNGCCIDY
jgi:hypothetical protein